MVIWLRWLFAIYANLLPFSFLRVEDENKDEDGKNKEIKRRDYLSSSESADESKSIETGCSI